MSPEVTGRCDTNDDNDGKEVEVRIRRPNEVPRSARSPSNHGMGSKRKKHHVDPETAETPGQAH